MMFFHFVFFLLSCSLSLFLYFSLFISFIACLFAYLFIDLSYLTSPRKKKKSVTTEERNNKTVNAIELSERMIKPLQDLQNSSRKLLRTTLVGRKTTQHRELGKKIHSHIKVTVQFKTEGNGMRLLSIWKNQK